MRDIVSIIDPQRAVWMKKGGLRRRHYLVRGPNHMWHIDGNDKIKPFGFCISGAMDGWSRKIIWLEVDRTNKDPKLICSYYLQAIRKVNVVPLVVRMDRGTENVGIADIQTLFRSNDNDDLSRCSVMFGSSNHNQRIERFWNYLRKVLLQSYMDIFKDLEMSGVLEMTNFLHMECLKFAFMPVIRKELDNHARQWNKHRVRHMKNIRTPTGIPNFLYMNPEFYDSMQQGKPYDRDMLAYCQELNVYVSNEYGCDDLFSEWALSLMFERGWHLPATQSSALTLFSNLILEILANSQ